MAGQREIQSYPLGLLEALGIKGADAAPRMLSPEVRGVVDLGAYYVAQRVEYLETAPTIAGLFAGSGFVVPAEETWLVVAASARFLCQTSATAHIGGELGVSGVSGQPLSARAFGFWVDATGGLANTSEYVVPWVPPQPVPFRGGSTIRAICTALRGSATIGVQCAVTFARLI